MTAWPTIKTAHALVAEGIVPCSEAFVRRLAKTHQIGRMIGRRIIFTPADVDRLIKALPCPSNSSSDQAPPSGISGGPSGASAYAKAQALLTGNKRKKSGH